MILYYDRQLKRLQREPQYGERALGFLYKTKHGRAALKVVTNPVFSKAESYYEKSGLSRRRVKRFCSKYNIPLDKRYKSFNSFFTRKHPPLPESESTDLVACADSRLSIFPVSEDLRLTIKNTTYSLSELLLNKEAASQFANGTCLVFRLTPMDNHHYFYFDDGKELSHTQIKGKLHTVKPISEKYEVFTQNSREVSILQTDNFGIVAFIEIGALLIGKINNYKKESFRRNEEKGYFEYGGSTIVILLNVPIRFDDDIKRYADKGFEVLVKAGEKIGEIPYN